MIFLLDSNVLIASERNRGSVGDVVRRARLAGAEDVAISSVSVVELTHGIYRGRSLEQRERRRIYAERVFRDLIVVPFTLEIGRLAGKIEGEQAALGIGIPFADLLIGATALSMGYAVATGNAKHFELIPGLKIFSL